MPPGTDLFMVLFLLSFSTTVMTALMSLKTWASTKRQSARQAVTPGFASLFLVSTIQNRAPCGAGLQDQMDLLFPERGAANLGSITNHSEKNMSGRLAKTKAKKEWPLVVYFGMFGMGILGYILARVILDGYPHPIHWASGVGGAVIGFLGGWLWYRWRGDII